MHYTGHSNGKRVVGTDRRKIETMIAAQVPRPLTAQRKVAEREQAKRRAKMAQAFAGWRGRRR